MLRSVAFSSSSMNTPRFTPPTTQVEAKSPPTAQTQRSGLQLFDPLKLFDRLRILPKERRIISMYLGSYRILRTELKNIQESHGSTPIQLLSQEERTRYLHFAHALGEVKRQILSTISTIPLDLRSKNTQIIFDILNSLDS